MINIEFEHYFWFISNFLILFVITIGIFIVVLGIKRTKTLKTGAGPWVIIGLALFVPSSINEILDELFNGILLLDVYPASFYDFIDKIYPPVYFIGGLFLIYGLYRQFLVGEQLSQQMYQQNIELNAQRRELSDFAHSLAHDLRSEISVILGLADLLKTEKEYSQSKIENIRDHVQQISSLLKSSVELADAGLIIDKTDLKQVDLNKLVNEVATVVIPSEITFSCSDELPIVPGDREKLYQVFKNLFENAVVHGKPQSIQVGLNISEREIRLYIRNDGNQIPLEIKPLLFQKDFTTRKNGKGIGLAIIQKIIHAHGWDIGLEANNETIFRITIPINNK